MKKTLIILSTLAVLCACNTGQKETGVRVVEDFNFGWKFILLRVGLFYVGCLCIIVQIFGFYIAVKICFRRNFRF